MCKNFMIRNIMLSLCQTRQPYEDACVSVMKRELKKRARRRSRKE